MPIEERRKLLERAAEGMIEYYESTADERLEWQAGEIVEDSTLLSKGLPRQTRGMHGCASLATFAKRRLIRVRQGGPYGQRDLIA